MWGWGRRKAFQAEADLCREAGRSGTAQLAAGTAGAWHWDRGLNGHEVGQSGVLPRARESPWWHLPGKGVSMSWPCSVSTLCVLRPLWVSGYFVDRTPPQAGQVAAMLWPRQVRLPALIFGCGFLAPQSPVGEQQSRQCGILCLCAKQTRSRFSVCGILRFSWLLARTVWGGCPETSRRPSRQS